MKELCAEYLQNKLTIDSLQKRNREIASMMEEKAVFNGKSTGHVSVDGYKVTLTRRMNITWNQDKLNNARVLLGDEEFSKVFTYEFGPRSKAVLDTYLELNPQNQQLILDAKTDKPGQTGIEIKAV